MHGQANIKGRKNFWAARYKALFNFNLLIFCARNFNLLCHSQTFFKRFIRQISFCLILPYTQNIYSEMNLHWHYKLLNTVNVLRCIPAPAPFVEIVKFDGSPQTPCVRPGPYAVTYPLLSESTWNLNGEPVQTNTMNMLYHVASILLWTIQVHKWQVIMFLTIYSSHNLYSHYHQFLFCLQKRSSIFFSSFFQCNWYF